MEKSFKKIIKHLKISNNSDNKVKPINPNLKRPIKGIKMCLRLIMTPLKMASRILKLFKNSLSKRKH